MSKEGKLIHNTMLIAISNICTKFISFLMMPLYTSLLTTGEYGVVDMIATYTSLIAMGLNMQLEQGVFRYLVEARGNPQKQNEYISGAFFLTISAIVVFVLIATPTLSLAGYAYTKYLVISVAANILSALLLQIPRGIGDNKAYAGISCISGVAHVLLNVLFVAVAKWGVDGMLQASILSHIITICLIVYQARIWERATLKSLQRGSLQELMAYSLPLVPYVFTWWIISASDRTIINFTIGVSFNGIYAVANKFASTYTLASNIFQLAWTESASESVSEKDRNVFYQKVFDNAVKFYSSCCMGIIALMPFVFPVLVSDSFGDAYDYIPVLLIAALAHAVVAFYGSIYFAFKKTKKIISSTLLAAGLNIVINLTMISRIGLYAAALSTLISYCVILVIRYMEMKKIANITINKTFLLGEVCIYIIVLLSYYSHNAILQGITLLGVISYCCAINRHVIFSVIKRIKNKLVRRDGKSE